jgi:GTP cyclohydrolase I
MQLAIEPHIAAILAAMDASGTPGTAETPARVAKWLAEFITYEPGKTDTAFTHVAADQMVIVSGIRVWSLCEHHLLPFWCDLAVGYIPQGTVLGLSKFGRIAHKHAHRLQIQERLVEDINRHVSQLVGHADVAVLARGEHLCMTMRGIQTPALMTSSSMNGVFRRPEVRQEFLKLAVG